MSKTRIGLLIVGIIIIAALAWYMLTRTKYKVGDILCNPPDLDTFTITGIGGPPWNREYTFVQDQTRTVFAVKVSIVDGNPTNWQKRF
jgi:hypothetical protein